MSTATKPEPLTLEVKKSVKAPVERVYKAWVEPAHISKWFGCGKVSDVRVVQDLRVGGEYRYEMHCNDGEVAVVSGTYKEVVAEQKTGVFMVEYIARVSRAKHSCFG